MALGNGSQPWLLVLTCTVKRSGLLYVRIMVSWESMARVTEATTQYKQHVNDSLSYPVSQVLRCVQFKVNLAPLMHHTNNRLLL